MSLDIDRHKNFDGSTLVGWLCLECRNLIELNYDDV